MGRNRSSGGTGSGMGRGSGGGQSYGSGRGRMQGTMPGTGPGGQCVCSNCGATALHQRGVPCTSLKCPECGAPMVKG